MSQERVEVDAVLGAHRVMVVLRGCDPDEAVQLAHRAWSAGVALVEVPLAAADRAPALEAVAAAATAHGTHVGAGTVLTPEHARTAARAGAAYTVAPGLDTTVLSASLAAGLGHLPGVATPSEVQQAYRAGCTWVKVFPAAVLGPEWVRAIRGPFPEMRMLATGGIGLDEAQTYLTAGARAVAFGAAAVREHLPRLTELVATVEE